MKLIHLISYLLVSRSNMEVAYFNLDEKIRIKHYSKIEKSPPDVRRRLSLIIQMKLSF